MKKIETVMQSHRVDALQQVLSDHGINKLTLLYAKEMAKEAGFTQIIRGAKLEPDFIPMIKVEVTVPDSLAETAITCIIHAASVKGFKEPVVFITNIEAVHIRKMDTKEVVEEIEEPTLQ